MALCKRGSAQSSTMLRNKYKVIVHPRWSSGFVAFVVSSLNRMADSLLERARVHQALHRHPVFPVTIAHSCLSAPPSVTVPAELFKIKPGVDGKDRKNDHVVEQVDLDPNTHDNLALTTLEPRLTCDLSAPASCPPFTPQPGDLLSTIIATRRARVDGSATM